MYEVPPGSRFVVVDRDAMLRVPLGLNVQLFGMVQSGIFCPLVERVTSPVGIPLLPITLTFTTTEEPCTTLLMGLVELFRSSVVVVALNVIALQAFTMFVTLTEPSPVAKS
jgi:hypothetical protein